MSSTGNENNILVFFSQKTTMIFQPEPRMKIISVNIFIEKYKIKGNKYKEKRRQPISFSPLASLL